MSLWQVKPELIDVTLPESGYPANLARLDTREALIDACGNAARDFPQSLWVEPNRRKEMAEENDRNKTWAMNYIDRFTHQGNSHECTAHSLRAVFEAARNRHRAMQYGEGPKRGVRYETSAKAGSVWVSPLSIYAEANPRVRGGANVRQVLEIAARRGMLPEKTQPKEYGFRHTLVGTAGGSSSTATQSVGSWVSVGNFPSGWQETAKLFRPLEIVFPRSAEEALCLILHGYALGVGRRGHAVPLCAWDHQRNLFPYPDSYDLIRFDSSIAWQGSFAIISTTVPDDWDNPV